MKAPQLTSLMLIILVASSNAFAPQASPKTSFAIQATPVSTKTSKDVAPIHRNHNAAFAAFTTALAPVVVQAAEIDESTAVGYGAGIVACVVSLAVGFSVGYGTLV